MGFMIVTPVSARTWWKVESLDSPSGLFDEQWETILVELRALLKSSKLPAWHPPKKKGFFRHIVVRKSFYQNKLLINLVTSSENVKSFDPKPFVEFLKNNLGKNMGKIGKYFRSKIRSNS